MGFFDNESDNYRDSWMSDSDHASTFDGVGNIDRQVENGLEHRFAMTADEAKKNYIKGQMNPQLGLDGAKFGLSEYFNAGGVIDTADIGLPFSVKVPVAHILNPVSDIGALAAAALGAGGFRAPDYIPGDNGMPAGTWTEPDKAFFSPNTGANQQELHWSPGQPNARQPELKYLPGKGYVFVNEQGNIIDQPETFNQIQLEGEQSGTQGQTDPEAPPHPAYNTIPQNLHTGIHQYVNDSQAMTDDYNAKADALWNDYQDFEDTFFEKFEGTQDEYSNNISSIPKLNMTLPDSLGGGTVPLAPKVHSQMYSDQAATKGNLINAQGNTQLAGMGSRSSINNNKFNVNNTNLTNSFMPTQTALDLYKMERAGEIGVQQANAGKPDEPSAWSTWAPVVGTLLSSSSGNNIVKSVLDWL